MDLILLPKYSPSNNVRVWAGSFSRNYSPQLSWQIRPVLSSNPLPLPIPNPIRPIQSVRPANMLDGNPDRAFTGIYEFSNCLPDTAYIIKVWDERGNSYELTTRTLPTHVSSDRNFNVLLLSCYHYDTDPNSVDTFLIRLLPEHRPDLTILMGDQVYLDLPWDKDFPKEKNWLANRFERDYTRNWKGQGGYQSGYSRVLQIAPSVSIPDDHEFWNNFPHAAPFINNTWTDYGRKNWTEAALANYIGFQRHDASGGSFIIDVPPLSFFISDMRTDRDFWKSRTFTSADLTKFSNWLDNVVANNKAGLFVTGQSLFRDNGNSFEDFELPDYGDYVTISDGLKKAARSGNMIYCLTGDVHWGRIGFIKRIDKVNPDFVEIITSPSSLVDNPADRVTGFFKNLFGSTWPKHSGGDRIEELRSDEFNSFRMSTERLQKGNQVSILSFRRSGSGIDCNISYYPLHIDNRVFEEYKFKKILPKLINI